MTVTLELYHVSVIFVFIMNLLALWEVFNFTHKLSLGKSLIAIMYFMSVVYLCFIVVSG